jgi:ABC-type transporter Mla MlaB component
MALQFDAQVATLTGTVTVEEAETLANWLKEQMAQDSTPAVHLSACEHVHAAVLQTLLALQPALASAPANPHLQHVLGALRAPESATPATQSATA